ncbi:TraR/DksA C4-type zinc finger protein [Thalassobacillus hwangdonensis]|uniref:TraR/DksA C4-type zinc finger protein n=1 Tax=Thalassobacillus hwangdonensis TaxID=546108 RepID=A0ABW3L709_9BACI
MLSDKQLQQFKEKLVTMKKETEAELEDYHNDEAKETYQNDETGELSSVQDHPANSGTDQFERAKEQTFYEQARERMMDIEDALKKIEEGTYGKSEKSGKEIPLERLEAMPTARYTVEEQEEMEKE